MGEDGTFCWGICVGRVLGMSGGEAEADGVETGTEEGLWLLNKAVSGGGSVAGIGSPFFLKYWNKMKIS